MADASVSPLSRFRAGWWVQIACIAFGVAVLIARRTDQVTDPAVWIEEGSQIIPSFLPEGARALFIPVNGYLVSSSRVIAFLSLAIGGLEHYPAISTAFGIAFSAAVFAWIGTAPLILRGIALLPLAIALAPSGTEVFLVGQYTFWFAGLALFSLVLWRPGDRSRLAGRIAVALVCGLSNPMVIPVALIAVVRSVVTRARHEAVVAGALLLPAAAQLWVMRGSPGTSAIPTVADASLAMRAFSHTRCCSDSPTGPRTPGCGRQQPCTRRRCLPCSAHASRARVASRCSASSFFPLRPPSCAASRRR